MGTVLLERFADLTNAELDAGLRDNAVRMRELQAEQAVLILLAIHRQVHLDHAHRSPNAYLRQTLNCSAAEASRLKRLAKALDRIDGLGDAWVDGHIGRCQIERFARLCENTRVRDALAEIAPILLEHAEHLGYREFDLVCARFEALADTDGAHDARDDAVEHRDAAVVELGDGVDIHAHGGDPVTAVEMVKIFDEFCDGEYRTDLEQRRAQFGDDAELHPLPRTVKQRRHDAMVNIFRSAHTATRPGRPAEAMVNIVIDATTFTELLQQSDLATDVGLLAELVDSDIPLTERRCHTASGTPIHPHDVLRAALEGHVRRVVIDSASRVVDLGRSQRLFTGAAREAAKLLVTHCQHPGCDLPADWCDVDHSTEWADGGATDQHNSGIECEHHNIAKHRRRWTTRRATNGRNYTRRDDGSIILPAGARPPVFPTESDEPDGVGADLNDYEAVLARCHQRSNRQRLADLRAAGWNPRIEHWPIATSS